MFNVGQQVLLAEFGCTCCDGNPSCQFGCECCYPYVGDNRIEKHLLPASVGAPMRWNIRWVGQRFAIATTKQKRSYYTVLDLTKAVRGPVNTIGGGHPHESEEDIAKLASKLELGYLEISSRNQVPTIVLDVSL